MEINDGTGLSENEEPTVEDQKIIADAIGEFSTADLSGQIFLFEGRLAALAMGIAQRYRSGGGQEWVVQLAMISDATSFMAAEDISAIANQLLEEPAGVELLRATRNFALVGGYQPDPSLHEVIDTAGCRIVVSCGQYSLKNGRNPIYMGSMKLLNPDLSEAENFEIVTGGGSPSHKITSGPLPPGRYLARNFRHRNDKIGMISGGVGYSVDLDACDGTAQYGRSAFRIHPDGAPFGTQGCIGVQGDAATQGAAMEMLRRMVGGATAGSPLKFRIQYTS